MRNALDFLGPFKVGSGFAVQKKIQRFSVVFNNDLKCTYKFAVLLGTLLVGVFAKKMNLSAGYLVALRRYSRSCDGITLGSRSFL